MVPAAAVGLVAGTFRGLGCRARTGWVAALALRVGYALAPVGLVLAVIAVGALLPWTRPMFLNNHYATLSGARWWPR